MNNGARFIISMLAWWSMNFIGGGMSDARESRGTANGRALMASLQESPETVRPDRAMPAPDAMRSGTKPDPDAAPDQQAVRFAVTTFLVEGNTILDQAKIDALLDRFKGSEKQIADVEHARLEL